MVVIASTGKPHANLGRRVATATVVVLVGFAAHSSPAIVEYTDHGWVA